MNIVNDEQELTEAEWQTWDTLCAPPQDILINVCRTKIREGLGAFVLQPNDKMTRHCVTETLKVILEEIVASRTIYDYKVQCDEENNPTSVIDKCQLNVRVSIQPKRSLEYYDFTCTLKSS